MQRILSLLALLLICANSQQSCQDIINNWIIHSDTLPPEVYMNSGKFINDLGDYNNCLFNSPEYKYFTMRFLNKLVGTQYIGLCAPSACSEQILSNNFSQQVYDYLNNIYYEKTNATTPLFRNTVFYSPEDSKPTMGWGGYAVISFVSIIVILGILGSIIDKITDSYSVAVKAVKTFSFYDNFSKIITMPKSPENGNLQILNGMRVLSIFWIVFGHDMWFRFMNIKNWMETLHILNTPGLATLVPAAYFAVDTFFWIGGFLVTIGLVDQMQKAKSFVKFYFGAILHRLIRIWPTYMLAILFFWQVAPYLSNGPIWMSYSYAAGSCNNGGILWNMFFIDNFEDHGPSGMNYCFGWGWYLAVDFQLFVITPFIILAYLKNWKLGWLITFVLFLASVICAFVLIIVHDWRYPIPNPKMAPQPDFMDKFYFKPYVRASAYFMGIFSGFLYYQWKSGHEKTCFYINKIKNSIPIRISFYILGIFLCELMIWIIIPFQTGESDWSTVTQAFYNSLNRVFFLLGMYLCIFAALFGCENDPSRYILGHRIFSPLAKVSFCVYLVHLIVIMGGTFNSRMDLYWYPYSATYISISDIFWSIIVATILSLLIESPTLGLYKIFLRPPPKKELASSTSKSGSIVTFEESQGTNVSSRPSLLTQISYEDSIRIKN